MRAGPNKAKSASSLGSFGGDLLFCARNPNKKGLQRLKFTGKCIRQKWNAPKDNSVQCTQRVGKPKGLLPPNPSNIVPRSSWVLEAERFGHVSHSQNYSFPEFGHGQNLGGPPGGLLLQLVPMSLPKGPSHPGIFGPNHGYGLVDDGFGEQKFSKFSS